jgi:hypothetical protein
MDGACSTHVEDKHTQKTFVGTQRVKDYLEDVSIDWRMILKYICKKQDDRVSVNWINVALDRNQSWALMNMVITFKFHKIPGIS